MTGFSPLGRPGASDNLEVELITANIHSDIPYSALSYVWGGSEKTNCIQLDNCCMPVTKNLFDALTQLRKLAVSARLQRLRLWVDAICIDQDNNQERNHQVRFMSSIYSSAGHVYVWLGHLPYIDASVQGREKVLSEDPVSHAERLISSVSSINRLRNGQLRRFRS